MTARVQRVENAAVAIMIFVVFVAGGYPWWALFALFLVFDLSALGYLGGARRGALFYNAVHNYTGPAVLGAVTAVGAAQGANLWVVALVASAWAFHVAVDRALGYGLKTADGFTHTHLGLIGKDRPSRADGRVAP